MAEKKAENYISNNIFLGKIIWQLFEKWDTLMQMYQFKLHEKISKMHQLEISYCNQISLQTICANYHLYFVHI